MLNTGVGPTINHKQKQASYLQKKPTNPLSLPRFAMTQGSNQFRHPMTNMPLQTNTLNLPRTKDGMPMASIPTQLQQTSTMKMDHLNPSMKRLDSPFVMDKDIPLSPGSGKLMASRRDTEVKGDQFGQMSESIMSMASPAQSLGENKATPGMIIKMNDKDLAKASDIPTLSMRIGNLTFKNCKISTKIHYGKKQITWEVSDIKPTVGQEKTPSKRKFEVQFGDIERIDINTIKNTLLIETKEKPQEYKEYNPISKKNSQVFKDGNDESGNDMSEDVLPTNGRYIIESVHPKDSFTKNQAGKPSQIDKLTISNLPLSINGKPAGMSTDTPDKGSMSLMPGDDNFSFSHTPQRHNKQNFPSMMRGGSSIEDMKFPNLDIGHQGHFKGNMNTRGGNQMYPNDFLQLVHSESEPMLEEPSQKDFGVELGGNEEEEEDDDEKEFPTLSKEKKIEVKKFENQLKTMKAEDKAEIILETIKPKRFGINPNSKKIYKCPIYKCSCQKHTPSLLKSHLTQKHKKLVEIGFGLDESGLFTWKPDAIDFVLMVTKMYPRFVKNIIRETKLS